LAKLSPTAVRQTIRALEAAGAIRGEWFWDRDSDWHAGHVGDGRVGKFKEVLTPSEQQAVLDRTREYCECFGYAELLDDTALGEAPANWRLSAVYGTDDDID
jgi:hypothetical protein